MGNIGIPLAVIPAMWTPRGSSDCGTEGMPSPKAMMERLGVDFNAFRKDSSTTQTTLSSQELDIYPGSSRDNLITSPNRWQ
jgi:hypothetical protein